MLLSIFVSAHGMIIHLRQEKLFSPVKCVFKKNKLHAIVFNLEIKNTYKNKTLEELDLVSWLKGENAHENSLETMKHCTDIRHYYY